MHRVLIALSVLALCGFATAQVTVISGYASNWAPGYSVYQTPGAYAAPFVPLVTTPSVSIETGMPTQIGASNATTGNVAGATNSTPGYSIYQTPGAYAAPFVPLVTTPSVSIETGMPTQIGASNATTSNVAGATEHVSVTGRAGCPGKGTWTTKRSRHSERNSANKRSPRTRSRIVPSKPGRRSVDRFSPTTEAGANHHKRRYRSLEPAERNSSIQR